MERTLGLIRLIRQSRRDSGIGFQVNVFKTFFGFGDGHRCSSGASGDGIDHPVEQGGQTSHVDSQTTTEVERICNTPDSQGEILALDFR